MSNGKIFTDGLIGKKLGMTQVFSPSGERIPVTVIQVGPCFVLAVQKSEVDGYSSVQLGFEEKKPQRVNKARQGAFAKAGAGNFYHVREIRCDVEKLGWNTVGKELKAADVFAAGQLVDVSGVTKGRGFQGVVRRYKVKGQPATRGTHEYRRHIGAIGCRKYPGRVFPNQRMPGHMGDVNRTIQNVEIIGVNAEENLVLVRGGIPGAKGGLVEIRKALKAKKSAESSKAA